MRSNGTVTYVGKDIAYHLWKFGLLGRDFGYKPFFEYADHECWISTEQGVEPHPQFGGATAIYNVIDVAAVRSAGKRDPGTARHGIHGAGGSLHPFRLRNSCSHPTLRRSTSATKCPQEDLDSPYIEMSGRKGFGVKADDLMDKLIAATRAEVDKRQTGGTGETAAADRQLIADQIAIGALRYFMLKFTRNSVIAFDFKDGLSFEGETGPYCQYAVVRIRNIFRKAETTPEAVLAEFGAAGFSAAEFLQRRRE